MNKRSIALSVLLLCAFTVTVDTTIVNVTLPTLSTALDASTRELQWIVDAYTLVFAALVLAAGGLGDRFGRRRMLLIGLGIYFVANGGAALSSSSEGLIGWRAVMGLGAAIIFPSTLSTIVHLFTERAARAKAIGLWGATTGVAVALGPIVGGALLESNGWEAAFWLKLPLAALAFALVVALVPESGDPSRPRVDRLGLALSSLGVLALVFTIIEAPEYGWLSGRSVAGFAIAVAAIAGFVAWEMRTPSPLLDVRLFRNARFSAASAAITFSFFALFGFIFLITQYFQILRDYEPFETGLRLLPVAISTGTAAVVGTILAVRIGNKAVVATGLGLAAIMFAWTSQVNGDTSYLEIAAQMVLLGTGMGFTSAPATESIMGAVPEANAGVGSGVNDTTRELGGTLGVAVIGSVFASLFAAGVDDLPASVPGSASDSIAAALAVSDQLGGAPGALVREVATSGFYDGLEAGCLVAAGVCLLGSLMAVLMLPARPADDPVVSAGGDGGELRDPVVAVEG